MRQIYVEIERARLTRRLAGIWEAEGKVNEAADTLQEVAVVRARAAVPILDSHLLVLLLRQYFDAAA